MKNEYIPKIIESIAATHEDADASTITAETHFNEIPGMDSMSVVVFQMHLADLIGEVADQVIPIMDMTINEYAEALESIS